MEIGRRIGVGKVAEVFEYGTRVAKLYNPGSGRETAFREAANLAIAASRGLPCPAVDEVRQFGERWGVVMERAPGRPFADAVAEDHSLVPAYLDEMVRLHAILHRTSGLHLSDLRTRLAINLGRASVLGEARQRRLLDLLQSLPAGQAFCHGDFHPLNVLGAPGEAVIVDWLDATCGPPAADVCRTYVLIRTVAPKIADAYVAVYAGTSGMPREAIAAWLPVVAAARTVENVPEELDALMSMADGDERM